MSVDPVFGFTGKEEFDDTMPLGMARQLLMAKLNQGAPCPCCLQNAKRNRFGMSENMLIALMGMYREYGLEWGDLQVVRERCGVAGGRMESKLRFWHLMEKKEGIRGNPIWRVTPLGEAFVLNQEKVPRWAHVYNNECDGLSGNYVGIKELVGPSRYDLWMT